MSVVLQFNENAADYCQFGNGFIWRWLPVQLYDDEICIVHVFGKQIHDGSGVKSKTSMYILIDSTYNSSYKLPIIILTHIT